MSDAPFNFAPRVAHRPIGPSREHRDRIAYADLSALGATQAGREDVRAEQHFFVRQRRRDHGQIRARVGDEQVLRPRAVNRVAKAPAAERAAALRVDTIQTIETLPARGDRSGNHALANAVLGLEPGAQLDRSPRRAHGR